MGTFFFFSKVYQYVYIQFDLGMAAESGERRENDIQEIFIFINAWCTSNCRPISIRGLIYGMQKRNNVTIFLSTVGLKVDISTYPT